MGRSLLVALAWALLPLGGIVGCAPARLERHEFMRVQMGVACRVVLYAEDGARARAGAAEAFDRIAALEQVMSDYREDSEASVLTREGVGKFVPVSDDLYGVLAAAEEVSLATDGAFDVTISPVVKLWREARRTGVAPTDEEVRQAWDHVGFTRVLVDRQSVWGERRVAIGREGIWLDFGGIGKGYAAHKAVDLLKERGFPRCMVALAGDIVVGEAPVDEATQDELPGWRIDVRTGLEPDDAAAPARTLVLTNAGVSTSGDSVQFFEIGGVRYAHIIDGRLSRRPMPPTLEDQAFGFRRGATVVSDRGEWADALGTALAILGPEWLEAGEEARLRSLLERFGNAWALVEWDGDGTARSVEAGKR
jgi:thiamine biosynthesis lipoprotein